MEKEKIKQKKEKKGKISNQGKMQERDYREQQNEICNIK